ncbi:flagellar export protein FliJ [Helicobacter sp. MIT 14-3879]|uniref:flagellar export protein FliJ n=1 Tax=Helicobacter sp. MIT 14-3879 TaxID=2040649 RepID=UPI000E1ECDCC|nr:flagellar export protein FliJ [Helicobacter sp. MIT 14-3879]RDU61709.1 hypothetical protein CQA44_08235 [Helicobacter sp. MIT 14-3879]
MKTKFSKILKLKQDILNKIEREILEVNNLISLKKQEILKLNSSINDFTSPKEGKLFSDFLAFRELISNIRYKIKEEQNLLEMLESRKIDTLKRYNTAKIEYEKINYLHLDEVKIMIDKIKRIEQNELDEFGRVLRQKYVKKDYIK